MIIFRNESQTRANPKTNTVLGGKCYHNRYLNYLDYKEGLCYLSSGDW